MIEKWIVSKVPKKERIAVNFCREEKGKEIAIAIITSDTFGENFQIYEVDSENKNIVLLATAKSPVTLEEKYIADKDGQFCLLKPKTKTKTIKKGYNS